MPDNREKRGDGSFLGTSRPSWPKRASNPHGCFPPRDSESIPHLQKSPRNRGFSEAGPEMHGNTIRVPGKLRSRPGGSDYTRTRSSAFRPVGLCQRTNPAGLRAIVFTRPRAKRSWHCHELRVPVNCLSNQADSQTRYPASADRGAPRDRRDWPVPDRRRCGAVLPASIRWKSWNRACRPGSRARRRQGTSPTY